MMKVHVVTAPINNHIGKSAGTHVRHTETAAKSMIETESSFFINSVSMVSPHTKQTLLPNWRHDIEEALDLCLRGHELAVYISFGKLSDALPAVSHIDPTSVGIMLDPVDMLGEELHIALWATQVHTRQRVDANV